MNIFGVEYRLVVRATDNGNESHTNGRFFLYAKTDSSDESAKFIWATTHQEKGVTWHEVGHENMALPGKGWKLAEGPWDCPTDSPPFEITVLK